MFVVKLRNVTSVIIISMGNRCLWLENWGSGGTSMSPMSSTASGSKSHVKSCPLYSRVKRNAKSHVKSCTLYSRVKRKAWCSRQTLCPLYSAAISCVHWGEHKILVNRDWPSEGCDRQPSSTMGTTPHQRAGPIQPIFKWIQILGIYSKQIILKCVLIQDILKINKWMKI